MSVKKQYLKNGTCKVTFSTTQEFLADINSIKVLGNFNNWDSNVVSMKKLKSGTYSQTISLKPGEQYEFRYLVNDTIWTNDPEADKYAPNGIDGYNSLITV